MEPIPLIDPPHRSIGLADGRTLAWQEFGIPDGRPTLYFHGGGSHSLEAGIFHREAVQRNIRLIATNRPGASGSSLCPGRPTAAYSSDMIELLDHLQIEKFACLGESNGGMMTLAIAATMADRVVGAVPINPTVPWFDPLARSVSPRSVAVAYRLMKHFPGLLVKAAAGSATRLRRQRAEAPPGEGFSRLDLLGPPPGIEPDAELAARIGTNRETVTREFGQLVDEGILHQAGRRLHILSLDKLGTLIRRFSANG